MIAVTEVERVKGGDNWSGTHAYGGTGRLILEQILDPKGQVRGRVAADRPERHPVMLPRRLQTPLSRMASMIVP